jgi:hypothetical protein
MDASLRWHDVARGLGACVLTNVIPAKAGIQVTLILYAKPRCWWKGYATPVSRMDASLRWHDVRWGERPLSPIAGVT